MNAESKNKHLISYLRLLVKIQVDDTPPHLYKIQKMPYGLPIVSDEKYLKKNIYS